MAIQQAFKAAGATTALALTTTLTSVGSTAALDSDGENVLIFNACAVPVACAFAVGAAPTATVTSSYVVPAGARMLVTVGRGFPLWCAAMPIGTASASVYFTRGDGSTY